MKILIVLTSHEDLANTGNKTCFSIEEFASPFYVLKDAGADIILASPRGGQPPIDPQIAVPGACGEATRRFQEDTITQELLANTKKLTEVSADDFDAVFYPCGHGPLWDLANNKESIHLIKTFLATEKPVAAVCHAPAALLNVYDENGDSVVKDKNVTGFSNTEEEAVHLTHVVPFSIQNELKNNEAVYSKKENWESNVMVDGLLFTGQNPASSAELARQLLSYLKNKIPYKVDELV